MKKLIMVIMALIFSISAHAEYVKFSIGAADMNIDAPFNSIVTDDDSEVLSIALGRETSISWLDVEAEYAEFNNVYGGVNQKYLNYTLFNGIDYESKAITGWLIGKHELFKIHNQPLTGYVRGGVTIAQGESSFQQKLTYNGKVVYDEIIHNDDTGIGLSYGVGLMYDLDDTIAFALDWKQYNADLSFAGESVNFDPSTVSFGVKIDF